MVTHTFTGDLDSLVAEVLTSDNGIRAKAFLVPYGGQVISGGDTMVGTAEVALDTDDAFSVVIPHGSYRMVVRYVDPVLNLLVDKQLPETGWLDVHADVDLSDALAAITEDATPGYEDHGDVSGTEVIDGTVGIHVIELTADTEVTVSGGANGSNIAVHVIPHGFTLSGPGGAINGLDTEYFVPFAFTRGEWRMVYGPGGAGDPIESGTPTAPTFTDGTMTLVIPNITGVQYKKNGTNIAAGTYGSQPAGPMTVTVVAKSGYILPAGTYGPYAHTYPGVPVGHNTVFSDTFTRTVNPGWGNPDVGGAYTPSGATNTQVAATEGQSNASGTVNTPSLGIDDVDVAMKYKCTTSGNFSWTVRGQLFVFYGATGEVSVGFGTHVAIPGWTGIGGAFNTVRCVVIGSTMWLECNGTEMSMPNTMTPTSSQVVTWSAGGVWRFDDLVIKDFA